MASQVASVFAKIGADTSGLDKGLASSKGKLKSLGGSMAKIGAMMTAGIS